MVLSCMLAIAIAFTPAAQATKMPNSMTAAMESSEKEIRTLIDKSSAEQPAYFANMVGARFKYVSVRSLLGKENKWLGFVDIYAQYRNGKPANYILQQASLQYGMQALPSGTEECTLIIGNYTQTISYSKQAVFSFPTSPAVLLGSSAETDEVRIDFVVSKRNASVELTQAFPAGGIPSAQGALLAMAPAYVNYIKNDVRGFDHSFLRLRSYLNSVDSLQRNYIWELSLVYSDILPSKATVIRYDCETKKIAISEREVRSYFS